MIGTVSLRARQREDTVINAIWATGMSLGVLFMAKTPGYVDPTSYLFGNIVITSYSIHYTKLYDDGGSDQGKHRRLGARPTGGWPAAAGGGPL